MRDGIVQINARPIRHAFLVDPTKDMSLFFESDTNVRASKNNLVRLVHEPEYHYQNKPGDEVKWAYRTVGAFDSPNKSAGTYTVLLLLRFFSDRQMLNGSITPIMSFNLKKQNAADKDEEKIDGKEVDLALFFQMLERDNIETIFAECKTSRSFTKKEFEKMEIIGKKFTNSVLAFAKLSNLKAREKQYISDLVRRSDNPILVLTGEDLLRQSLDEEHYLKGYADFYELCRRTWYKHLEVE